MSLMKTRLFVHIIIQTVIHFFFWVGVYYFYIYFLGYGSNNVAYVNRYALFLLPITIVTSYVFYFYLIPNYLLQNKKKLFLLYTVYTLIISSFFVIVSILYGYFLLHDYHNESTLPITKTILTIYLSVYFIVFVVISISLISHNFKSISKNEELKTKFFQTQLQLKEQELKYLKMQIHPHFLFNTLNTMYGFALKKSEETPEIILKLSGLLDYILYQVNKPSVLLKDEIQHIENYISLEKIRFQDSLKITFNKPKIAATTFIQPMLLLPFVENAFKHGKRIDGLLSITVAIQILNDQLLFDIKNSSEKKEQSENGIGLENIKKRLDMLFADQYDLKISEDHQEFNVSLKIPLRYES